MFDVDCNYMIVDTPGHRDHSTNMFMGAPKADGAQIRGPADGDFEMANRLLEKFVREESERGVTIVCTSKERRLGIVTSLIRNMPTREFQVDGALKMNLTDGNYTMKDFNDRNLHTFLTIDRMRESSPQKGAKAEWTRNVVTVRKQTILEDTVREAVDKESRTPERHAMTLRRTSRAGAFKHRGDGVGESLAGHVEQGILGLAEEVKHLPTHVFENMHGRSKLRCKAFSKSRCCITR
eukprot:TRINITY_DN13909_c0_g1_i2.p1 TRINITY_DN13909_c0_g1~~TRINITY_DN13909_c0_g1_i2.p1  ORF type:complete len:237 (+),score=34.37 TRINITY_DN13909_c0_g1_i2:208-918(+)